MIRSLEPYLYASIWSPVSYPSLGTDIILVSFIMCYMFINIKFHIGAQLWVSAKLLLILVKWKTSNTPGWKVGHFRPDTTRSNQYLTQGAGWACMPEQIPFHLTLSFHARTSLWPHISDGGLPPYTLPLRKMPGKYHLWYHWAFEQIVLLLLSTCDSCYVIFPGWTGSRQMWHPGREGLGTSCWPHPCISWGCPLICQAVWQRDPISYQPGSDEEQSSLLTLPVRGFHESLHIQKTLKLSYFPFATPYIPVLRPFLAAALTPLLSLCVI